MNTKPKDILIWDLDDTLWLAFPAMLHSVVNACESAGLVPPTKEELKAQMKLGGTMLQYLYRIYAARGLSLSQDMLNGLYISYVDGLMTEGYRDFTLFDNAVETLQQLHDEGWPMVALSNKDEDLIKLALEHLGVAKYFEVILGTSQGMPNKPHPHAFDRIESALREQGLDNVVPSDCVMLGDEPSDCRFALADFHLFGYPVDSKMRFVYCTWGVDAFESECFAAAWAYGTDIRHIPSILNCSDLED